jgi:thioredoxin reductase (NADPH)
VVGSGSAAASGALNMLAYARTVHLVCDTLEVSPALAGELRRSAVKLHEGRKVKEIIGPADVAGIVLDDVSQLSVQGVFIELGARGVARSGHAILVAGRGGGRNRFRAVQREALVLCRAGMPGVG